MTKETVGTALVNFYEWTTQITPYSCGNSKYLKKKKKETGEVVRILDLH